jgi:chromosome segregation protein
MYLKSIEISGFKSFGKKSVLDFNVPISAIVGPNGSGKSNVAESFSFVLGEQSIKSLRGKRAEDLIFNGGKDAPRSNRASVKTYFDNTQKIFNIDFDEVSIERVVNRDSSSEYFINGSSVRLKDIIELLSSAHIGASGYQIISQGEADKVLNSNTKERREMIEDALGLKVYQNKKDESIRKLDKTEENIKQTESLRREIAPHLRFLKKQVEKIEKMFEMKEDLTNKYNDYLKREEEYIKFEKQNVVNEKQPLIKKSDELNKELLNAKDILAKSKTKDVRSDEIVKVEDKLKEVRILKDTLVRSIGRIEGEISSLEKMIKKQSDINSAVSKKTVDLSQVENVFKQINLEIDGVNENFDFSKVKEIFSSIKNILRDFIERNKDNEDKQAIIDLENEIKKLVSEKNDYEYKLKETNNTELELSEQYTFLKNDIEKEKDTNRDAEKALFRIVAEQNEIRGKLNELENREIKLKHDEEEFIREIQEGSILVGACVLRYKDFWPVDENNNPLSAEQIFKEPRQHQEERRRNLEKIKIRLEDAGVAGGDDIVKEFKETTERDAFLEKELEDLVKSSESLKNLIKELDEKLATEFRAGVDKINTQFQQILLSYVWWWISFSFYC